MAEADVEDVALRRLKDAVRRLAQLTRGRALTGLSHQDADDAIGTVATDDAHHFDPLPLLRKFHEYDTSVVVIGQVAGIMHGSQELTGDLDLLWDGDEQQAQRLADTFASVSADLFDENGVPVRCEPAAFRLAKVLFRSEFASGDCCTPALPWRGLPIADILTRCDVVTAAEGFEIRYLSRTDLVQMRRAAGRSKDLRRAEELERLAATTLPRGPTSVPPESHMYTESRDERCTDPGRVA